MHFSEDILLQIPRFERIKARFINRGVYVRTKCHIVGEILNPNNLDYYLDCLSRNRTGHIILDEIILVIMQRGLLKILNISSLINMLIKVYDMILKGEEQTLASGGPDCDAYMCVYLKRREILSAIILQCLAQLHDFRFEGYLDNPMNHQKDKKREFFQTLISQLINNLDYLYQAYVLNDIDSQDMFGKISSSEKLYCNNLALVQILSEIKQPAPDLTEEEILAYSNFSPKKPKKRFFSWNFFSRQKKMT